jgi:protein pelota
LQQVYHAILQHVDFAVVKVLLIASPGFIKDTLYKYIIDEAQREQNRKILDNRDKIVLVHSSSGHKHALTEILEDPLVQAKLGDTKFQKEVSALDLFYKCLANDPARAFYGYEYVVKACELGAIETLMVTDDLFRSSDIVERRKFIKLFEEVENSGGKCMVFSSLHTSGEQLKQLTGIAAILHFAMPDLEETVQEEEEVKRKNKLLGH